MTTFMQPFQCDLPPQLQETHRTTHTGTTTRCKTHRRNNSRQKRPQPHPLRTDEVPFIAGCNHFTRKNTRFRAPASSPQHSPCNIHAAITFCVSQHPVANLHLSTDVATPNDNNHAAIPMRSATTASRNA